MVRYRQMGWGWVRIHVHGEIQTDGLGLGEDTRAW